ncbi:MAG: PKD domain-containing protein [Candidatus Riflebacteria bacterium]|nr:PKD domain-containing protein [Candidatus Riflebacteria bacterium]
MAENNRNFSIFLLVLALIGAALFYGCGSSATSDKIPDIEYSITGTYNSQGLTSFSSARAVSGPAAGILIYSESDPGNYADIDTNNRTYIIRNLRPGNHYIVFKHIPFGVGGATYICRSEQPVVLTETNPVQKCNELKAVECNVEMTGKLLSSTGQPITPAPTISLWGQTIEVNPITGEFTTPKMPEGTTADLVINAINYKQTTNTVTFSNNPAYHEITAVETTVINIPPSVDVSSKDSRYNANSLVILTAEAEDNGNKQIEFSWTIESCTSPNKGELASEAPIIRNGKHINQCYWYSPSENCLATITVTVRAKDTIPELSSKAKLHLKIGDGDYKPNNKPVIIDTTIYPESLYGSRVYTITCIATDTEMDALTHQLTISPSGSILQKASGNTWKWTTPELEETKSFTLNFEVRDQKGNLATYSRNVSVNKSQPNEPPYVVSQNPSSATDVMSGKEITLKIEAKDPENEKLTFNWSTRKGQIKESSETNTSASIVWVAPYLNNATSTTINCIVSDPYQRSVTATYTINIIPDPSKKAPESQIIITGSDIKYKGSVPLFKVGETVTFTGMATDSNRNITIDPSHFTWTVIDPEGKVTSLPSQKATTQFSISNLISSGDYQVRLSAIDLNGISGEQTADFRINSLPIANIICEGNKIDTTGRMETNTTYTYNYNSKAYDVFQVSSEESAKVHFVASCTDIETESSTLESSAQWSNGTTSFFGREYEVPLNTPGLTTIQLTAKDSKGEQSATATYQYYVNQPPVIETATSTKSGFINTDVININAKVKDEASSLSLAWYISTKDDSGNYGDYQPYTSSNAPDGAAPSTSSSDKEINSKITVSAEKLVEKFSNHTGFRFKFIASDSMGGIVDNTTTTPAMDIEFNIVTSHEIKDFEVASGTYGDSKTYTNFEVLKADWGISTAPYVFPAKSPFSMRSGSTKWGDNMTWTWYDIPWANDKPGSASKISESFGDAYTLNGYSISSNFGTHTIRLEGKSNEFGIVASNSVDIFINSTPQITFAYTDEDMIRFDTDSGATLTVNISEDNPNELLGLRWTIQKLNESNQPVGNPITFNSHDLDSTTTEKSSISMGGKDKTSVTIYWTQIPEAPTLASGVFRITAQVYDAYEASSTASIDILINRLPEFRPVSGEDCIEISVPAKAPDNGDVYSDLPNPFTTTSASIPVYLTEGLPSMYLKFRVDAFDYELNKDGININTFNGGKNIVWNYTDSNNKPMEVTGQEIGGRFSVGLNTIRVEVRDSFYDTYEGKFKTLAVSSYTQQFFVWHSQSEELENDDYYTATNLFKNENNKFYVQLKDLTGGSKIATYSTRYQIILGAATTFGCVTPFTALNEIPLYKLEDNDYKPANATETPGILAIIPTSDGKIIHLTDTSANNDVGNYIKYESDFLFVATYSKKLRNNALIYISSPDSNGPGGHVLSTFFRDGYPQDADAGTFAKKFISLTYSSSKDDTAGAYILKDWPSMGKYSIGVYSNTTMSITPNYTAVYQLDGKDLALTDDSKLRCISNISGLDQQLFLTDTINNRIIRVNEDMAASNKLVEVTKPIDIISTANKYIITLSSEGENAINVYQVDNASATLMTSFGSFAAAGDRTSLKKRAGKVLEPRALFYYTKQNGDKIYGGLVILEKGRIYPSRIQIIRTNLNDFLE